MSSVVEAGKGKHMFRGVVTKSAFETRDGFTYGDTVIRGTGKYEGHTLHVWYQNENIISWLDDAFFVTVPDLICLFDLDEKMPQLNPYAREGENVAVDTYGTGTVRDEALAGWLEGDQIGQCSLEWDTVFNGLWRR